MNLFNDHRLEAFVDSKDFFDYSSISQTDSLQTESYTLPQNGFDVSDQRQNSISDYLVAFSGQAQNYCVGLVDMSNSTKIAARLGIGKTSRYYQVFLNSMSKIVSRFSGFVIKNVGDSLLYYFPDSSKEKRKFGFMSCIECNLTMIEAREIICRQLEKEGLPKIDYRISLDYGSLMIMRDTLSGSLDFLGPPLNIVSKINHSASRNGIVIGGDLYQMVKSLDDYCFKPMQDYSMGLRYSYPVYSVTRKD